MVKQQGSECHWYEENCELLEFFDRDRNYKYQRIFFSASPMLPPEQFVLLLQEIRQPYILLFLVAGNLQGSNIKIAIYSVTSSTVHYHPTLMLLEDSKSIISSYSGTL